MSKIELSREGIVDFAHCVIQAMQCEWEGCTVTLNSWNTLSKHLSRHCSHVVPQGGAYQCSLSRCSGRLHSSLGALKTHVELSHLSRVALPCPVRDCMQVFVRLHQIQGHFEHAHRELIDKRVSLDVLAPLAIIAPPRCLRPPPPFPNRNELLLNPVLMPPIHQGHSQASASQGTSRKWSRLNVQDDESDDDPIAFNDLSSQLPNFSLTDPQVVDIEVQRKLPLVRQPLLSRPQPVIYPPKRSITPEQITLYPNFVRMVDKLVATGALAGRKEGGV